MSSAELSSVPRNTLSVVRRSDHTFDGRCWVGSEKTIAGDVSLDRVVGAQSALVGCSEHDVNGGDCHIRGVLKCH